MPTKERIEAAAKAVYADREGPVNNADFSRQARLWDDCLRHARLALEAAERAAWCDDMSKAPKDEIIDVWLGDAEPDDVAFYCTPGTRRSPGWAWENGKWRPVTGLNLTTFVQPTHWRHLPEPPQQKEPKP